jgi:hypothetical protein
VRAICDRIAKGADHDSGRYRVGSCAVSAGARHDVGRVDNHHDLVVLALALMTLDVSAMSGPKKSKGESSTLLRASFAPTAWERLERTMRKADLPAAESELLAARENGASPKSLSPIGNRRKRRLGDATAGNCLAVCPAAL